MSDIWLGDLIRAWHKLGVDAEEARAMATLMGFSLPASTVRPNAPDSEIPAPMWARPAEPGRAPRRVPAVTNPVAEPSAQPRSPGPARRVTFARNLRPVGVDVGLRAGPGNDQPQSAELLPPESPRRGAPLPLLPLLSARVAPGILTAAVATDAGDGRPDVDALVELVAQRRFEQAVPRVVRASLFRGVQLLLDRSPAMAPFARDVTELARTVRSTVGHNVEEISLPGRPEDWLRPGEDRYSPPHPGTPVLAISDLGIGRPPGHLRPEAHTVWLPLADLLLRRGSQLVALVPYPRSRWPALGDRVRMIPWDTTTSPADVVRAVGRILGGPRGRS